MEQAKKKKKSHTLRNIIIGIVVLIVAGSIYSDRTKSTAVRIGKVRRGGIAQYVEERARTSLPNLCHLTMPDPGRIEPISLQEGDRVTNGQVVATLDRADLDDAMTESKEIVTSLQNAVKAALAQIRAAEARKEFNEWIWKAKDELYKKQLASELDAKEAKTTYLTTQVDYEESQADAFSMEAMLAVAKLFPIYVNRRLRRTVLTSPIDGVVLKRYVWNEQVLQPGEHILDIGDMDHLEITSDILTQEALAIRPGNPVEIRDDAAGPVMLTGTVKRVEPQGFTKVSSLGVEQQRVPVKVGFDRAAFQETLSRVGLAYRLYVRVITAQRQDTLIIPRTALFRGNDGQWKTYAIRKGKAEIASLKLGIINNTEAEVLEGLSEGDQVIIAPESTLKAGTRVKADQTS